MNVPEAAWFQLPGLAAQAGGDELPDVVAELEGKGLLLGERLRSDADRTEQFIAELAALSPRSGLPSRLRDAGVPEDSLPRLAADAMLQQRLLVNNPREVSERDALAIYRAAF